MKRQTRPFTVEIRKRSRKPTGEVSRWDASALIQAENASLPERAHVSTSQAMREAEAIFAPAAAATPRVLPARAEAETLDDRQDIALTVPPVASGDPAGRSGAAERTGDSDEIEPDEDRRATRVQKRPTRRRQRSDLPLGERWKRHLPIWKR